jgi:hypothetical protein
MVAIVATVALFAAVSASAAPVRSGFSGQMIDLGTYVDGPLGQTVYWTDSDVLTVTHPDGSVTTVGTNTYLAAQSNVSLTAHFAYTSSISSTGRSVKGAYWIAATGSGNVIDAGNFSFPPETYDGRFDNPEALGGGASTSPIVCSFSVLLNHPLCG